MWVKSTMRVAEISNPSSFHTATWVKQLIARNIDTSVFYPDDWLVGSNLVTEECSQHLISKPSRAKLVSNSLFRGKILDPVRDLRNRTTIHTELNYYGPQFQELLTREEIEVVHAHFLTSGFLLAKSANHLPAVVSTWGSDLIIGPTKYPYLYPLIKKSLGWVSIVHVMSDISKKIVQDIYPVEEERIFKSTWGIDTDFFNPKRETTTIREKLGLDDGPNILSFRAMEPLYRIDLILRTFKIVLNDHPQAKLVLGNGGSERSRLQELATQIGIESNIVFTGRLTDDEMADLFSLSDVYVQCPISDGVTISGMQAMASGVPLIANNVGEVSAILEDGKNGFFVENADDPESYAEKITLLLQDEGLRKTMANESRASAVSSHDRTKFLDSFIELLEGLI